MAHSIPFIVILNTLCIEADHAATECSLCSYINSVQQKIATATTRKPAQQCSICVTLDVISTANGNLNTQQRQQPLVQSHLSRRTKTFLLQVVALYLLRLFSPGTSHLECNHDVVTTLSISIQLTTECDKLPQFSSPCPTLIRLSGSFAKYDLLITMIFSIQNSINRME